MARASTFVERCWTLVGSRRAPLWYARRRRPVRGRPHQVTFDGPWVLAREEQRSDVVGFYHTHPPGVLRPSRRDVLTMRAWVGSFGKPLLCLIESAGQLAAWRFDRHDSSGTPVGVERFPRGVVVAIDFLAEPLDIGAAPAEVPIHFPRAHWPGARATL